MRSNARSRQRKKRCIDTSNCIHRSASHFLENKNSTQQPSNRQIHRSMRLSRRQKNPPPDSPIFSDAHSMGGGSTDQVNDDSVGEGKNKFQARIIVTEGVSNIDPCIEEPSQEAALDTTIGLEDASDCSDPRNELVIITSAVLEPDSEEDEETAVAIEEAAKQPGPKKDESSERGRILKVLTVILVLVVVVAIIVHVVLVRTRGDENKSEEQSLAGEGVDADMVFVTMPPTPEQVHVMEDHVAGMNDDMTDALDTPSPSMAKEMPSMSPSLRPSAKPSESLTSSPSQYPSSVPSQSPTMTPSQPPSMEPSLSPSGVSQAEAPSEAPSSATPRPTNSSQQIFVSISQTMVGPSTTTTNDKQTSPPIASSGLAGNGTRV